MGFIAIKKCISGLAARGIAITFLATSLVSIPAFSYSQSVHTAFVQVKVIRSAPIYKNVWLVGSLSAPYSTTVSSSSDGHVIKILFHDGQNVKAGAALMQLDDTQQKADLADSKARASASNQKLQRSKSLRDQHIISPQDFVDLTSTSKEDMAMQAQKQDALDKRIIRAPFAGQLGQVMVSVGDYVTAGKGLVSLINTNNLQVNYQISEDLLSAIYLKQKVFVSTTLLPHMMIPAAVDFISPEINVSTRTVNVHAVLINSNPLLKPGLFVRVQQPLKTAGKPGIMIPEQALLASADTYYVYCVENNRAIKTIVKPGIHRDGKVQIVSGLKTGMRLVVKGQSQLKDQQEVHVISK